MCSAVTVASAAQTGSAIEFFEQENAVTKITYTDSTEKIHTGIINPESIEQSAQVSAISAYEIVYNGEKLAFTVSNLSPAETFEGKVKVSAYCPTSNEFVTMLEEYISIEAGGTSEEITVTDWEKIPGLQGTFLMSAVAEGSCGDEPYIIDSNDLAYVKIKELRDTRVSIKELDIDPYDGVITLPEAIENCPEGGTVTFKDTLRRVTAAFSDDDGLTGEVEEITIDKDITIDASYVSNNGAACGVKLQGVAFKIAKGKKVTLRGLNMDNDMYISRENGGMIYSQGELTIDRCMFQEGGADVTGGSIYINGGTAKISNSTFCNGNALYGGALAVNGGAKADIINCSFIYDKSRAGAVQNINGELNIVNS